MLYLRISAILTLALLVINILLVTTRPMCEFRSDWTRNISQDCRIVKALSRGRFLVCCENEKVCIIGKLHKEEERVKVTGFTLTEHDVKL